MRVAGLNLQTRLPMLFDVEPERSWKRQRGRMIAELAGAAARWWTTPRRNWPRNKRRLCEQAGGGALLPGLDKRLGDHLGIPVLVADAPLACAGAGMAKIMEAPEDYELDDGEDGARGAALNNYTNCLHRDAKKPAAQVFPCGRGGSFP